WSPALIDGEPQPVLGRPQRTPGIEAARLPRMAAAQQVGAGQPGPPRQSCGIDGGEGGRGVGGTVVEVLAEGPPIGTAVGLRVSRAAAAAHSQSLCALRRDFQSWTHPANLIGSLIGSLGSLTGPRWRSCSSRAGRQGPIVVEYRPFA